MKEHLPLILVALLVLAALVLWLLIPSPAASPTDGLPSGTTTVPALPEEEAASVPKAPASGGIGIVKQTTLQVFSHESWAIELRSDLAWKMSVETSAAEEVIRVSYTGTDTNVIVSKDMPIGEPANLSPETYTRSIAGQEVEVHEYTKPNEKYAYYLFFTLRAGGDDYAFSIRSFVESKEPADDFIDRITVK
ncbi:hypothetical protein L0Y34_01550 [Candidatus Parcubacteria bacterium]|nr:hypothetical protein [Candidatus Parcubacteria bacterium]